MDGLLQLLAPIMASVWTIAAIIAGLILWASISAVFLSRGASNVRRALERATRRVQQTNDAADFARQYESVAEQMAADPVLGPRWQEFDDSLLRPRPDAKRPLVHSTGRPDSWFDLGLLSYGAKGVDLRYHAALPNLLVGVGLFFTFLGLAVALSSAGAVVSGSSDARNVALKGLLDAASFKFLTSLAGLLLSIVYALFRKFELKKSEKALHAFNAALEARAPLVTQADLQRDANDLLEKQATYFESFSNDLALNLGSALDRSFDVALERHLGPLAEALDKLSTRMSSSNEDAMQHMLDSFVSRLQGGAGDKMQEVTESLSGLGRNLEGLQSGLGDAAVRMAQSADAMATRMGEGAEAALSRITEQMGGLTETLRAVAEQTRTAGVDAGASLAGRIEQAARGFEDSARSVGLTLTGAAEQLEARMGQQAEASAGRMETQLEGILSALREVAETSRSAGAESFAALSAQVGQAASVFERTAEGISASLGRAADDAGGAFGRGAEDAIQRIASATEGMRAEFTALAEGLRGASTSAAEALRSGGADGAAALRESLTEAGGGMATAMTTAADRIAAAGEQAGSALAGGGEQASRHIENAGSGLSSRAEALGAAAAALAGRLAEFERAAAAAADPLSSAASDMRAAGSAARESVTPLAEVAQTLGRTGDQIGDVSQRLSGAQGAADTLSRSLAAAADRFAGVDRSLAETLRELQQGLTAFSRQVGEVVQRTDTALASAVTRLEGAIRSLEAVLEDFDPTGGARR